MHIAMRQANAVISKCIYIGGIWWDGSSNTGSSKMLPNFKKCLKTKILKFNLKMCKLRIIKYGVIKF